MRERRVRGQCRVGRRLAAVCVVLAVLIGVVAPTRGEAHVRSERAAQPQEPDPTVLSELTAQVTKGRLDEAIYAAVAARKPIDAFAVLEDARLLADAAAKRDGRGIRFDDAQALDEKEAAYRALKLDAFTGVPPGIVIVRDFPNVGLVLVRVEDAVALLRLLQSPDVRAVRAVGVGGPATTESLPLIQQPRAFEVGFRGEGVIVAVLDGGLDYTRRALGSCTAPVPSTPPARLDRRSPCRVSVAREIAVDDMRLDADDLHGTNVAGIVAAVAPETSIWALDVLQRGLGDASEVFADFDVVDALAWLIAQRRTSNIVAVNMSLNYFFNYHTTPCASSIYVTVFANLRDANILPIVSAANDAYRGSPGVYNDGIAAPACVPGTISVGAVYDADFGGREWSSARGPRQCVDDRAARDTVVCFSQSADMLSILAPGSAITAAEVVGYSGTSMAAPHVAGAVAALASACALDTAADYARALTTTGPLITDPRNGRRTRRLDLAAAAAALPTCPAGGTRLWSSNFPDRLIRHATTPGGVGPRDVDLGSSRASPAAAGSAFIPRAGLDGAPGSVSFESAERPGWYLRRLGSQLRLARDDATAAFSANATFRPRPGLADRALLSFEAVDLPDSFIRHRGFGLWVERRDGSPLFAADATFRPSPAAGRTATAASGAVAFDAPPLGLVGRQVVNPYVAGGVRFTAATDEVDDAVVGVVRNNATSACADPADNNQKLGTGRNTFPDGSIGLSDFAIRATYDTPLTPAPGGAVRVAVEFQTIAGTRLRLRLYDASGAEVAATVLPAEPAAGTCGFPGPARAWRVVAAEARGPVAYAVMDTLDFGVVFVLDEFRWSPAP